jgi:hypothetical protein
MAAIILITVKMTALATASKNKMAVTILMVMILMVMMINRKKSLPNQRIVHLGNDTTLVKISV